MKTKVLIVPALIVISGFVSLQYLKPDFDLYMEKRIQRDAAKESSLQAEAVANNVKALKEEITTKKEQVDFVKRYLPQEKDQARMFDSLNFLTTQSGLLASDIQVKDVEEVQNEESARIFAVPDSESEGVAGDPTAVSPSVNILAPYVAPKTKQYSVQLEALGGYSNIKDLLKRLIEFDRIQDVQSFKISVGEETTAEGEEKVNTGILTFTYTAALPYQALPAPLSGGALVAIPGFNQASFDFATIDAIRAKAGTVPDMVLGTEGKANPFE